MEQTRPPEATAFEQTRCGGTRNIKPRYGGSVVTNDVPGCPKGGLLLGTDKPDNLEGRDGDDEIRGLGAKDVLIGGSGSNVIYGGPGDDFLGGGQDNDALYGGPGNDQLNDSGGDDVFYGGDGNDSDMIAGEGEDVIYGGDGNDFLDGTSREHHQQRDKLYCGEGRDHYLADPSDYVSSSCEVKAIGNPTRS